MLITEVVAALVWDGGKFMICQRPKHKGKFVGGKVEPSETKEQAHIQEVTATAKEFGEYQAKFNAYPDIQARPSVRQNFASEM